MTQNRRSVFLVGAALASVVMCFDMVSRHVRIQADQQTHEIERETAAIRSETRLIEQQIAEVNRQRVQAASAR